MSDLELTEEILKNKISNVKNKNYKLYIASPMYGGMCHGLFLMSCLAINRIMNENNVVVDFSFLFNESLITRARNFLVDSFLKTDFTHMLFIDSDIEVHPGDVLALLSLDKELIGGPYPKKSINWETVACAARKNPDMNPKELEKLVGSFVFNLDKDDPIIKGEKKLMIYNPVEVLEIGTGFMLIKRCVFEKMKEVVEKYRPDHGDNTLGELHDDGNRYVHSYFDTVIDTKDSVTGGGSNRYLSEDYMFCQVWRKIGGKVHLCPWMKTKHIGSYAFTGDMASIALTTGKVF
jgi:hypothetical protein